MNNTVFLSIFGKAASSTEEYSLYYHTKKYLKYLWNNKQLSEREVFKNMGYSNYSVFQRRVKQWLDFDKPIPRAFLSEINFDMLVFEMVIEADQKVYESKCDNLKLPKTFVVKLIPAVYQRVTMPDETDICSAFQYIADISKTMKRQCILNYQGIKTANFYPDGRMREFYYKPGFRMKKGFLSFYPDGTRTGTTSIA
jgi:hypothetical protein